jgi:prolyl oligopeptidase
MWTGNSYPPARRADTVDVYKSQTHGEVKIPDPYQWLEENTKETRDWTSTQQIATREYLDRNLDRQRLEDEIRSNTNYVKVLHFFCVAASMTATFFCGCLSSEHLF